MNPFLIELEKKIISLKSSKRLKAIKAEFEAEGTRIEELAILSHLCTTNSIPLTLKVGGPCAKRDIYEAFQIGANEILVPMVESAFAMEYCADAYMSLIPNFQSLKTCPSLSVNIESKKAIENIDSILESIKKLSLPIKSIVIGRSDLANSLEEKDVNSELILNLSYMLIKKCKENNLKTTIGGNLTRQSFDFIKNFDNNICAFESRKCTFSNLKPISQNSFNALINDGLEFELSWLNFKKSLYQNRSEEENFRISNISKRINQ